MKLYIGTSGFSYSNNDTLKEYIKYYNTVEINSTFYRFYKQKNIKKWIDNTPKKFVFSFKVNRLITHYYKLTKMSLVRKFMKQIISPKIKCILFEFPKYLQYTDKIYSRLKKLENLLKLYPPIHIIFEFRNQSFYNNNIYELCKKNKWTIAVISYNGNLGNMDLIKYNNLSFSQYINTSNILYMRLHGTNKNSYTGSYKKNINEIIDYINKKKDIITTGFIYFNNTDDLSAFDDAYLMQHKINNK